MHRFFVPPSQIKDKKVYITDKGELRHIQKVLRLNVGDRAIVFDGEGTEFEVTITEISRDICLADIDTVTKTNNEPKSRLILIQGIAKGDKMDTIVQKAVEVGISGIYPVLTERTVVNLDSKTSLKKIQRWQSIALEACKQCRRNVIPTIYPVSLFDQILDKIEGKKAVLLFEKEENLSLRELLRNGSLDGDEIYVIIGPEGGFSDKEVIKAKDKGINIATLGKRILRTETAGLVGSAIILYELGYLG